MLTVLFVSFAVALAAPLVHRALGDRAGWALALLPAGLFAFFAGQVGRVTTDGAVLESTPWVPSFGVDVTLYLDGLSLLFALLITGLGTLVVVYAGGYLKGDRDLGRFYLALLLFMSAMLGLVLSSNLIALFVFWELTSFSSYLLIGYKHDYPESRRSALQALLVTGGGGLALLAGFVLLGIIGGGTFELRELMADPEAVRAHALYPAAFALVALGALTKSAQFPFHFWLPNAMAAPTPVSAYLHSATMVKAGIYLLMRLDALLGGTALWTFTLSTVGVITMLLGAVWALRQTDLKKTLAYSTVTALGTLTLLVGLSFEASIQAAVVFLLVHALYKGALFMIAGSVDHETGTRDVLTLGGLRKAMPFTFGAAALAGLSMAGVPPLFGFVGKELAYKAKLGFEGADILLPGAAVLANALTLAAAGIVVLRPFFGALGQTPRDAHEAPPSMWIGPAVLAAVGLVFGLLPTLLAGAARDLGRVGDAGLRRRRQAVAVVRVRDGAVPQRPDRRPRRAGVLAVGPRARRAHQAGPAHARRAGAGLREGARRDAGRLPGWQTRTSAKREPPRLPRLAAGGRRGPARRDPDRQARPARVRRRTGPRCSPTNGRWPGSSSPARSPPPPAGRGCWPSRPSVRSGSAWRS